MAKKKSNLKSIYVAAIIAIVAITIVILLVRQKKQEPRREKLSFLEHTKEGNAAFYILGNYFDKAFKNELGNILLELPPDCRSYFICNEQQRAGLIKWMQKQNLPVPKFYTSAAVSTVAEAWARDIILFGTDEEKKVLIVSPDLYAKTEQESRRYLEVVKELFPEETEIVLAPFVFEGGNLVFLKSNNKRILLLGKKVLFDNVKYQRNLWTPGWDRNELLGKIQTFLDVDSLVVLGSVDKMPPEEVYFESRLDMGLAVLREQTAVAASFPFGEKEKSELKIAIAENHPLIQSIFAERPKAEDAFKILSERLETVSKDYDHYAGVCKELGMNVLRSPTDWEHVAAWMSWTNILQAGPRILMPVYPESLGAVPTTLYDAMGRMQKRIDFESTSNEKFDLTGYNLENYRIYQSLAYEVSLIPEYMHYFTGGLHRFVNILY